MKKSLSAAVCAAVLALVFHAGVAGQQAGVNTPVLPGVPADPADPHAKLKSDLLMNRQVEPELLVSTRNPLHMIAFFNDYRAVDLSNDVGIGGSLLARSGWIGRFFAWMAGRDPLEGRRVIAAAEATTGMARSYDGGVTWTGGLVPGSPDDPSPAASMSPAWGLDAMTDPRAVAAPCGRGYLFNVAFTRGGASKLMVTRFEDKNDSEGGETWHMLGQTVIETGQNAPGHFHDLPYPAVDIARTPGAGPCDHVLYLAWARFSGSALASKIMFAKSVDGGLTWTHNYIKSTNKTDQGLVMTVDPRPGTPATGGGGTLYVGWRVFPTTTDPSAMMITSSTDFGATFPKAVSITGTTHYPYDQPSLNSTMVNPSALAFRSNSFMSLQSVPHPTDPNRSTLFAAWQERVNVLGCPGPDCGKPSPTGDPRIVISRSADGGLTWIDPQGLPGRRAVDFGDRDVTGSPDFPKPGFGYLPVHRASGTQVMPRLSFGGGRLALGYLEGRGPLTSVPGTAGLAAGIYRQFDARLALLNPVTGELLGTNQVSRYPVQFGANLENGEQDTDILKLRENPEVRAISDKGNSPGSGGGTTPFFGDYLGVVPPATFVLDRATGRWRWAIKPADVPFRGFHMVFPDSRHVIPPDAPTPEQQVALWPNYSPPGTNVPSCVNPGSRNHDVMHTLVDAGVPVNSIASYKELGVIARTFPVTVTNTQGQQRYFKATLEPADVSSFHQFDETIDQIFIEIFPYSSSTRAVTVRSPTPTTSVTVHVTEQTLTACDPNQPPSLDSCTPQNKQGGDAGSVTLNLDPTNADNVEPTDTETHNPLVTNPLVTNPLVTNPLVTNPLVTNPLVTNKSAANPLVTNPLVTNPLVTNSALSDETVYDVIDATWKVTNLGTDGTAYLTQVALANAATYDGNYVFHLFIYRVAAAAGLDGCTTTNLPQDQLISSIPNPFAPLVTNPLVTNPLVTNPLVTNPLVTNPLVTNSTFASAPSETPEEGAATSRFAAAAVEPPAGSRDGTLHDDYKDEVFVTVRAYQIVPDSAIPLERKYDPTVNPPSVAVISQTTNTVDGIVDPVTELPGSFGVAPDLTIADYVPAATPLTAFPGGAVTLSSYRISNVGDGGANSATGQFQNGFYLSNDAVIDPLTDRRLDGNSNTNDVLPAGGSFGWGGPTLTIPADVAPGSYFIGVFTDDAGQVLEKDEFNNQVSEPLVVAAVPAVGQLEFVTQPSDVTVNQGVLPAVQVAVRDASGLLLPGIEVNLGFGANPGDTGLTGAPQTTNASGIATFSNLRVGNSGVGYTLLASVASVSATSVPFNVFGFGTGQACTVPSYAVSPGLPADSDPAAIAAADFNGDGHADLAVANRGSSNVSILLGDGLGAFGAAAHFSSGTASTPTAIVAADFDRDGDIDLATSNAGTTNASLLSGNGDGTFAGAVTFPVPGFALTSIAAGDVNGDGRLDLVVPSVTDDASFAGSINVLLGNAEGFSTGPQPGAGTSPADVVVADFNGDGRADIAVAHRGAVTSDTDGAVAILLAGGPTGFLPPVDVAATAETRGIAAGDFNDDGVRDLAVVHTAGVDVFQGNAAGTFALVTTIPIAAEGRDITISDFNGDGLADIVVTTAEGLETIVKTPTTGFEFNSPIHTDPNFEPRGVVSGDWNKDGRADAAVANGDPANDATVLVNTCGAFVVTNTNDSGPGSLRQVIIDANASNTLPRITFNIPGAGPHTIVPQSALPQITRPMEIDGTTQPGWSGVPVIELDGAVAGAVSGLSITAGNSVVRGLAINGFVGSGIALLSNGGNRIQGNYVGLDITGATALPNGTGVSMSSSGNNLIGGFTAADRNVISGNLSFGVISTGGIDFAGNEIVGNYIGTNAAGTAALGNLRGVGLLTPGAVAANVISGNTAGGIEVSQDDNRAIINRNLIGTNAAGTAAIPNIGDGIIINDAEDSIIGGFATGAGNVVSGNTGAGIRLIGDASATTIQGNFIGTNATGTAAIGNGGGGVVISSTFSTQLGGTTAGARNIISGNGGHGVFLDDSRGNFVLANYIGTNVDGTASLPNAGDGIRLTNDSSNTFIGMPDGTGGNVISGNGQNGISILASVNNVVAGNLIGTDMTGNADMGNGQDGVAVSFGPNTIGGVGPGRNVISGNGRAGVSFLAGGNGNTVQNNYIGTSAAGAGAIPNGTGVLFEAASANLIGGAGGGEGNLISGNLAGVAMEAGANNNNLMNNLIGTNAAGTGPLPNDVGVSIGNGTENFVVNGVIAFNNGPGVDVRGGIGNSIAASIHSNGGLGIDLGVGGVTPNDAGDVDAGPNSLQNFPVIASATTDGTSTTITGTAFGIDTGNVDLAFYVNAACDPQGNGEGQQLLGTLDNVVLNTAGSAPFTFPTSALSPGQVITATATDHNGSTSEFSPCATVTAAGGGALVVTTTSPTGPGSLSQAILDANAAPGSDRITFNIPGTGPHTITPTGALPPITGPVFVDGPSQAGYDGVPVIVLNGQSAGTTSGLSITGGSGSRVTGLSIVRYSQGAGILLTNSSSSNRVDGNYIGVLPDGTAAGNLTGIQITDSPGNTIGGLTPSERNVISGNTGIGINIFGASTGNVVQGNFVGINPAGTAAAANFGPGISVQTPSTTIGGSATGAGNVISGNSQDGIQIVGDGNTTTVQGNVIGLNAAGTAFVRNGGNGILISSTDSCIIGGQIPGTGNVISGNLQNGISIGGGTVTGTVIEGNFIGTDGAGTAAIGNVASGVALFSGASLNTIGGTAAAARNIISGNQTGVTLSSAASNTVAGNYIGTDVTGTIDLGNTTYGVAIAGAATGNAVGGGNVISGNNTHGIGIFSGSFGTLVVGNRIGTTADGLAPLGNGTRNAFGDLIGAGVAINDAPSNFVGSTQPGQGNLISGNGTGVLIENAPSIGNVVLGNFIGTDVTGAAAIPNRWGIFVFVAPDTTVGGPEADARNVISGNSLHGIQVNQGDNTRISANYIGVATDGVAPRPNTLNGIYLLGGEGAVTIGGSTAAEGNVIGGNGVSGIRIESKANTFIQGNSIGVSGETAVGNGGGGGISMSLATASVIGGPGEAGNRIMFNTGDGIDVSGTGHDIRENAIDGNGGLGIDLAGNGVTLNDAGDADTGANEQQNFPVITNAFDAGGGSIQILGSFNGAANTTLTIRLFQSAACDASGFGEGTTGLQNGTFDISTDGAGNATFNRLVTGAGVAPGTVITATATGPGGNTSEFSACRPVILG